MKMAHRNNRETIVWIMIALLLFVLACNFPGMSESSPEVDETKTENPTPAGTSPPVPTAQPVAPAGDDCIAGIYPGRTNREEVIALLADQGFTFACHRLIYDMVTIYRKYGVPLTEAELFNADRLQGKVVVLPPGMPKSREWKFIKNPYTIFLSGWALDQARRRAAVDLTLPLSDHADYPRLIEFITQTKAPRVYTFHGFPTLALRLREQGLTARHLEKKDTIELMTGRDARPGASYDLFN